MRQPLIARIEARSFPCEIMLAVGLLAGCSPEPPIANAVHAPPASETWTASEPSLAFDTFDAEVAQQFSVPDPSPSEPVTAAMRIDPQGASAGDSVELLVYVRIARAHFVHAAHPTDRVFAPVEMTVALPEGITAQGEWRFPPPEHGRGDSLVYRNSMLLRRRLKVTANASLQTVVANGELSFEVCSDELCWPLRKIELSAPLTIQPKRR